MALDMAMGGSTNTILHTLAAAQEGAIDFTLNDIEAVSDAVPCLSKVAPNGVWHIEDVHRAGGIPAILGELRRSGHLKMNVHTALYKDAGNGWMTGISAAARNWKKPAISSWLPQVAYAPPSHFPPTMSGRLSTPTRKT